MRREQVDQDAATQRVGDFRNWAHIEAWVREIAALTKPDLLKRWLLGTHQGGPQSSHLHYYLDEFTFRYNNRSKLGVEDTQRAILAIKGAEGKRLTYDQPRI